MSDHIKYQKKLPIPEITDFVESFWAIENDTDTEKEIVVLPDGRVDIFFTLSATEPFHIVLMGLETEPVKRVFQPKTFLFAISLKLLSIEYLLETDISDIVNKTRRLPVDYWGFSKNDINDFESFCQKATAKINDLLKPDIDDKKRKLLELVYTSCGSTSIKELSEKTQWNSRQINRYFTKTFGLPLKAYCNILRFRASFEHIKDNRLFPELNFADQAHFIREVKKLSGVIPKELAKNKDDRFIQFSVLPKK